MTDIVFAGGGTGGHLMPALAMIERLPAGVRPHLISCGRPIEQTIMAVHSRSRDTTYHVLPHDAGRAGKSRFERFGNLRAAERAAARLLRSIRPGAVVGVGGYASIPTVRAAARLHIPITLLEQNAVPGRATELLAPLARQVLTSLPLTRPLPRSRCVGNPTRAAFARVSRTDTRTLLVLGGSQGADTLNRMLPPQLASLDLTGWTIRHQCGPGHQPATEVAYAAAGLASEVCEQIVDMPAALATAGIVIARSGATTLAEAAVVGCPLTLVPHPRSIHDHQRRNAEVAARFGAAVVDERNWSGIGHAIAPLLTDRRLRRWRSEQIKRMARPAAAADCVAAVLASLTRRRVA